MSHTSDTRGPMPVAVALSCDSATHGAPRVSATGRGAVAEQILEIAFANGVKVREDADLAQLLATLGLDSPIPLAVFATVAEILTYVYRASGDLPEFIEWPTSAEDAAW